jgi:hypothetical protein
MLENKGPEGFEKTFRKLILINQDCTEQELLRLRYFMRMSVMNYYYYMRALSVKHCIMLIYSVAI